MRRATHLEGRSRNRRRCASKAGGRLVRRAISGKLHRPEQQHRGGAGGTLEQSVLWLLRCQSWLFSRSYPRAHSSPGLFHGSPAVAAAAEATEAARQSASGRSGQERERQLSENWEKDVTASHSRELPSDSRAAAASISFPAARFQREVCDDLSEDSRGWEVLEFVDGRVTPIHGLARYQPWQLILWQGF